MNEMTSIFTEFKKKFLEFRFMSVTQLYKIKL